MSTGFWNLYLIKRRLYLWKCEVNTPIAPRGISLGMKVLQLENRFVSARVHTPLKYLMHITNTLKAQYERTKAQLILLHNQKLSLQRQKIRNKPNQRRDWSSSVTRNFFFSSEKYISNMKCYCGSHSFPLDCRWQDPLLTHILLRYEKVFRNKNEETVFDNKK